MLGREQHTSKEGEQLAMFERLSAMYLINTVLMPVIVFSFPYFCTQVRTPPIYHTHSH